MGCPPSEDVRVHPTDPKYLFHKKNKNKNTGTKIKQSPKYLHQNDILT